MSKMLPQSNLSESVRKNYFETREWAKNGLVCGIDEVGRGCLAGPLVAAAVILPPYKTHPFLKDSKLMTPEERLRAYSWILKHCWFSYGIVHNRLIDTHNIYQATLIAMKKALVGLLAQAPHPNAFLIDAMPLNLSDTPYSHIPVHYFPFGERKSSSIAAASIVAKVTRDEIMNQMNKLFPGFELAQHKGYATTQHRTLLHEKPTLIIHRQSFLKNLITHKATEKHLQNNIFSNMQHNSAADQTQL